MNCHDALAALHGYLDGELDLSATLEYEQHLRDCPACSKTLADQKTLRTAMKADALYYHAPENLRERVRLDLHGHGADFGARVRWKLAAAACLVCGVGLGIVVTLFALSPSKQERLAQEVMSSHIRSLQVDRARLVDVRSSDRHEVKPWLTDKLDFSPPVTDLAKQRFDLIGGRLDYVDGRPVATLVYERRKHVINVFIWPDPAHEDSEPRHETRQGFHLIHWSGAGMTYWVVSDLTLTELQEFVQELK
jgi:anti-sigma factor (TIGR02949 family)